MSSKARGFHTSCLQRPSRLTEATTLQGSKWSSAQLSCAESMGY